MKKLFSFLLFLSLISYNTVSNAIDFSLMDRFLDTRYQRNISTNEDTTYKINTNKVILGDELLLTDQYSHLIDGKKVGVIVNQTSVNSKGKNIREILKEYSKTTLTSLYAPEHGIDGKIKAGEYFSSYTDKLTNLPVYSLYGDTREPTKQMLKNIDVMLFDLQDIGSRTYTYISTMYKSMEACKKYGKTFVVLDRPNPISCKYVEGFIVEDSVKSFVGIDNLPMAHGMTVGELAQFFNRNIGVDLKVVPMKNYTRDMIWQDTGIPFKQTSPYIPNIESAFLYMATGQSEEMGIGMGDNFNWAGGKGINSQILANKMNSYNLQGVEFIPQNKGASGGVKVKITDYHTFNPAKTGYYIMATANEQKKLSAELFYKNGKQSMFYKISGNKNFAKAIKSQLSAIQLENEYRYGADEFRANTKQYYLYK